MTLENYKQKHKHKTCYILGNGSSLRDFDFSQLKDKIVFGTNRIYLSGFIPTYYVSCNSLVLGQYADEIAALDTIKFLSDRINFENKAGEVIKLNTRNTTPGFYSPEEPMWEGHTVTYVALQLAYYMGFEKVILLGVDHNYGKVYPPNRKAIASREDTGHFHPEYFSAGKLWHTPDLAKSEFAYTLALNEYQNDNRRIINASSSTKLEVFPIQPLTYLHTHRFRVSAVISAYYAESYMEECMKDFERQSEVVETVVVCKAGSVEEEIARANHASQIITTEDIPILAKAWNIGARAARGKYIIPACTDDRLHPNATRIMADVLDTRPGIDIVYADVFVSWEPNTRYEDFVAKWPKIISGRVEGKPGIYQWPEYNRVRLVEGCFIGPQPMYRANLHQRYGYFDEDFTSAIDYEFWLRCAREANYYHIPYPLGVYLARPDSLEYRTKDINIRESEQARRMHTTEYFGVTVKGEKLMATMKNDWGYLDKEQFKEFAKQL